MGFDSSRSTSTASARRPARASSTGPQRRRRLYGGAGGQGPGGRRGRPPGPRWAACTGTSTSRRRRATRASASTRGKSPSAVITGFGSREFDAEGRWVETRFDTARRKLSIISCYFPSGSSGEERQEAKFRFLARMLPAPDAAEGRARIHPRRRRQHRAQGDRPEELAQQPEEQRLPARGTRLDDAAARRAAAWSTSSARSTRTPTSTPGGATAARPGPRTSAGGSTTTWRPRASRPRPGASTSTWNSASATTRR